MAVDYPTSIHFQEKYEIQPSMADQITQKVSRFATPRLFQLWGVDESKPHCGFNLSGVPRNLHSSQESITVEHL